MPWLVKHDIFAAYIIQSYIYVLRIIKQNAWRELFANSFLVASCSNPMQILVYFK